ncbi:MAG: hypothetical protein HY303_17125 [Candidatus Wallbacteria bacterium]|nr:hypothetical protein [Candidatus Wallbacteria bacterium]
MNLRTTGITLALVASGAFYGFAGPKVSAASLDVEVESVLVQADWNADYLDQTDADVRANLKDSIEGSVSFMVDVPFKKIVAHMQDAGTLGKISPNIESYKANKVSDDDKAAVYKVSETLAPFKFPLLSEMGKTAVNLDLTIVKSGIKDGRLVVDYTLDKAEKNDWKRFDGHIYAVDTHSGKTMVMIATSTKSNYTILGAMRIKLAKHYLGKTKDNIVKWLESLGN